MSGFINDLRFGLRQLIKRPGFAAAAILTLALGIGANTAVFSVLNGYLLKPLPYPQSSRLAAVGTDYTVTGGGYFSMSLPIYNLIREDTTAFSSTAVYNHNNFNVEIGGVSTRVPGVVATGSLFQVLGVAPALGHGFAAAASEPGKGNVALISNHLWRRSFGANPDVIGQMLRLDGKRVRIIGVMPRGFAFPERGIDIWAPMTIAPSDWDAQQAFVLSPLFIGRLKSGVKLAALRPQLDAVRAHLSRVVSADAWQHTTKAGFELHAKAYRQTLVGDRTSTILLLQGAVLLVLMMTCVNVANLLLSRVLGRSHEIAMRSALGASRAVLARQLLVESLWLAIPGGVVGMALGWLSLHLFASSVWTGGGIFNVALDWRVSLAALSMVCIAAALVSVLPIRYLAKTDLQSLLQTSGHTTSGGIGTRRVRSALVTTQLALATALLAASGLLLHSFINLEAVNPGFRKNNVLIGGLLVPESDHAGNKALNSLYHDLLQRARALPGVEAAGIGRWLPFGHLSMNSTFDIRGRKVAPASAAPSAWIDAVDGGYFNALGLPILRGRNFDARDTAHDEPVVIVDTNFARKYFGGANPLGRQIKHQKTWHTIIGVVPAVKSEGLTEQGRATVYLSAAQASARSMQLVLHTSIAPDLLSRSLHKTVAAVDPAVALYAIETMRGRLADSLHDRQTTMTLLLAFGGIALALAVVGVYGVLSFAVSQRRTECGIRLALGAMPGDLLWLFIKDGLRLLGIGLIAGLILAVIFGFLSSSRLFGVAPFDPTTLAGTIVALTAITLIACYLPARRASKLDPAVAIMEQ